MRRIIYDVAVSADGFICGPSGDISSFPATGDHLTAYQARLATYSTVIMGRQTYEFGYGYGLEPGARAYPDMDHHIFSRTLELPEGAEVAVVRVGWSEVLERLRKTGTGDIYLCGGGLFAAWVAGCGALDRLRIKRAPAILGNGIRLFDGLTTPLKLRLDQTVKHESGVVFEDYAVLPS